MHENLFQAIYDSMQEGLYSFDSSGRIIQVNLAAQKILGYSEDELIGSIGHNLFHFHAHNHHLALYDCHVYRSFLRKENYKGEELFRKKDGDIINVEVSCSPVILEGNSAYVVLFRDITEQKRNEKRLATLGKIVEVTDDIIVIKDLNLRVMATNDAFVKVAGKKSVEELIGKTDAEIFGVSPDTEPIKGYMEDEKLAQQLPKGKFILKEEEVITKNGDIRVYQTRKFPIYDQNELIATANISVDITKQKEYEQTLEAMVKEEVEKRVQNEYIYGKIYENANLGICITNTEGRFVAVNPHYCEIYGYDENELIGKPFTIVLPPSQHEMAKKMHDDFLIDKKGEFSKEWVVLKKGGKPINIVATASVLENVVGGPYKITTVTDVTQLHEAKKLQKDQEAMLIQQSKLASMGEMLGAIAHQWRQPLNVISCTALNLKLKNELGTLDQECMDTSIIDLEKLTQDMSKTIDDFMNFFKPSKKRGQVNLKLCIDYVFQILSAQFKNHQIICDFDIDENLSVQGVKGELEQVVLNILINAKDEFTEKKIQEKHLFIQTAQSDKEYLLFIRDNAGGIDEVVIDKIFDPFFTTKEGSKGSGIGLYMSSVIMNATFGGKITAKNIKNTDGKIQGAEFCLSFPKIEQL